MECVPENSTDLLVRGDALADGLLRWLAPLRFAEAVDRQEHEAAYRLRGAAVLEEGMADEAKLRNGLEYDEFDADAVHIIGWDGGEPIATCRLVFPSTDRPLPLERVFGPLTHTSGPVVEWGRVVVDSRLRGQGGRIFMGLAARGWLSMRARGVSTATGVTPERLVGLFRALGFPVIVIGASRVHWGVERVPILCEGLTAVRVIEHLWDIARDEAP